ncbi:hypothetical protein [Candidatus Methylocalor cossyra]|uniref:Uncharacterized protein n=1 Tax=Candidatus Methylocalor cossyra TaxID=3108543 RepID=A0ABM9NI20_9GAMM
MANNERSVDLYLTKLNDLLTGYFHAAGSDFPSVVKSASAHLPNETAQLLAELAARQAQLRGEDTATADRLADFAFACGRAYEQLSAHRRMEMEAANTLLGPESIQTHPMQSSEVDLLARFVEVRDRWFRKVADFTLKLLLAVLGVLLLGLVLGLL